jgi:hypothetical protein
MVQKLLAVSKLGQRTGLGAMRVMTDVSAERYWTVVSEREVTNLEEDIEMTRKSMKNKTSKKQCKGTTISSITVGVKSIQLRCRGMRTATKRARRDRNMDITEIRDV